MENVNKTKKQTAVAVCFASHFTKFTFSVLMAYFPVPNPTYYLLSMVHWE